MHGPIPYIPICKPDLEDIEYLPRIKMTSERRIFVITHSNRNTITREDTANIWGIGINAAERTLK